jgi:hypothetical protein
MEESSIFLEEGFDSVAQEFRQKAEKHIKNRAYGSRLPCGDEFIFFVQLSLMTSKLIPHSSGRHRPTSDIPYEYKRI